MVTGEGLAGPAEARLLFDRPEAAAESIEPAAGPSQRSRCGCKSADRDPAHTMVGGAPGGLFRGAARVQPASAARHGRCGSRSSSCGPLPT